MTEQKRAVSCRANNDESRHDTATEVLDSGVIKGFAERANLYRNAPKDEHLSRIIEANFDD